TTCSIEVTSSLMSSRGYPARKDRSIGRYDRPVMTRAEERPQDRTSRILDRIRSIPPGYVRTYGDIDPAAPRLVGRVLAETDEDVPWHRVVRSDGSVAKGSEQLRLLRSEGVPLRGRRVDMTEARLPDPFGG